MIEETKREGIQIKLEFSNLFRAGGLKLVIFKLLSIFLKLLNGPKRPEMQIIVNSHYKHFKEE